MIARCGVRQAVFDHQDGFFAPAQQTVAEGAFARQASNQFTIAAPQYGVVAADQGDDGGGRIENRAGQFRKTLERTGRGVQGFQALGDVRHDRTPTTGQSAIRSENSSLPNASAATL
ncbi:hypothetical protein ASF81_09300 [Brevundimonas sp. Leaf168]|nr:hypothetical protein ASF81_09300 [Brevundimonas sp. Leaf168]